jgi:hypothetical protein
MWEKKYLNSSDVLAFRQKWRHRYQPTLYTSFLKSNKMKLKFPYNSYVQLMLSLGVSGFAVTGPQHFFIVWFLIKQGENFTVTNRMKSHKSTGVLISTQPDQEGNKLQRQKILMFIYPIYYHNWKNISSIYTLYVCNKTSSKRNILTVKQNTSGSRSV